MIAFFDRPETVALAFGLGVLFALTLVLLMDLVMESPPFTFGPA